MFLIKKHRLLLLLYKKDMLEFYTEKLEDKFIKPTKKRIFKIIR